MFKLYNSWHPYVFALLRNDALEPLFEIEDIQKQIDCEDFLNKFKNIVKQELLTEFEKMWANHQFNTNLMILSQLKENYTNTTEKAW